MEIKHKRQTTGFPRFLKISLHFTHSLNGIELKILSHKLLIFTCETKACIISLLNESWTEMCKYVITGIDTKDDFVALYFFLVLTFSVSAVAQLH